VRAPHNEACRDLVPLGRSRHLRGQPCRPGGSPLGLRVRRIVLRQVPKAPSSLVYRGTAATLTRLSAEVPDRCTADALQSTGYVPLASGGLGPLM
jgi:hypothetical protein